MWQISYVYSAYFINENFFLYYISNEVDWSIEVSGGYITLNQSEEF